MEKTYDLLLKNGLVIDPSQGINKVMDVAITGEKVSLLAPHIDSAQARHVFNVTGKIVTPGLIDSHVHCYHKMSEGSVSPDRAGVYNGVTTVVDVTGGPGTLMGFRKCIAEPARTNVYCIVNAALMGLVGQPSADVGQWSEYRNWNDIVPPELLLSSIRENRDMVLGVKFRAFGEFVKKEGIEPIKFVKKIALEAGVPFVVHIGSLQGPLPEELTPQLLKLLGKGDILYHLYTAKPGRPIEPGKPIMKELREAKERGVHFDMSHGWFGFSFETARYGIAQGILPDIISSDLAMPNVFGPVYGLCETMSKMMAVGLTLEQVVTMATINPAQALQIADRHGSLQVGRVADISILELAKTKHVFADSYGATLEGSEWLVPIMTIRSGKGVA